MRPEQNAMELPCGSDGGATSALPPSLVGPRASALPSSLPASLASSFSTIASMRELASNRDLGAGRDVSGGRDSGGRDSGGRDLTGVRDLANDREGHDAHDVHDLRGVNELREVRDARIDVTTPGPLARASERVRFHKLLRDNLGSVSRYLGRLGISSAEVDDAAQEVFLVASSKLDTIAPESERAFLFATAARVAQNTRRAQFRRARAHDRLVHLPGDPSPSLEELTDQMRARALLDEVLEEMPVDLRGIFVLFEIEEMSVAEIATRLALPQGTAASRLRRARETFHERITRLRAASARSMRGAGRRASLDPALRTMFQPEVFSWWVSGGEVDALAALLDVYGQSYPDTPVVNAAVRGTATAKRELRARMQGGTPPDTFQANGGDDLLSWVKAPTGGVAKLDPLDFLADSERWTDVFPKDIVDVVSYAGHAYAVPLNVHRTNTLFFNRRVFAELGLAPPRTLPEFHETARTLRAHGVTPLALGCKQPWTLSLLAFENLLVAVAGADYYREFFSGLRSPDDGEIARTLRELDAVLDVTNDDAPKLSWDQAADRVRTGEAAMTIMGDWTKGYLKSRTKFFDEEFGAGPSPGTQGTFVFTLDTFSLPKAAPHRSHAIDLLKVFGSREGQNAFNLVKGSIPARTDVDLAGYDALSRATARDFERDPHVPTLSILVPGAVTRALDVAMAAYLRDRDDDAVLKALRANYARLRT